MKRATTFTLALIMILSLAGCGKNEDELIGKWSVTIEDVTITREFKSDGTTTEVIDLAPLRTEGTYTTDGGILKLSMTHMVDTETGNIIPSEVEWEFSYSVLGDKLTLVDLTQGDTAKVVYSRLT